MQRQLQSPTSVPVLEAGLTATGRPTLGLLFPIVNDSFTGYAGGELCSRDYTGTLCGKRGCSELIMSDVGGENRFLQSGVVTSAVPEPASLVLLGTGLLGAVASWRRRASR